MSAPDQLSLTSHVQKAINTAWATKLKKRTSYEREEGEILSSSTHTPSSTPQNRRLTSNSRSSASAIKDSVGIIKSHQELQTRLLDAVPKGSQDVNK